MNPLAVVFEIVANAVRAVRNVLSSLRPAPDFVVVRLAGSLPERRAPRPPRWRRLFPLPMAAAAEESLEEWRERFQVLSADPRVKGVVLKVGDLQAGATSLESLRAVLERYRANGKQVIAYLPTAKLFSYYLASIADVIVVPESGELALHGPRVEATFLRVALDRLGILPQFHHIAEYKSAANRYLYPTMPAPQREMVSALLDSTFSEVVAAIARGRQLPPEQIRDAIDQGILSASQARTRRLIDAVGFEDDLPRLLAPGGPPATILPWEQARGRVRRPYRWRSLQRQSIGVVQLIGAIVPGESREFPFPVPLFGRVLAGHETVARAFRAAERLSHIKAIVFHVDSPGGSAVASDLIWREVGRVQRTKPVVVHMGNVAGSGGYYVACGARHIVAGATTLTGSIGVVSGKFNAEGAFEKGGLRREVLARGETGTMESAFTSFTTGEWATMRRWMEEIYARFKDRVAAGRGRSLEEIEHVARGRVWTGRQALEHRLVDEVGDFDTAVRRAKEAAGIPVDADTPVVTIRPPKATAIPAGSAAAWMDAVYAVTGLLHEQALLVTFSEVPH